MKSLILFIALFIFGTVNSQESSNMNFTQMANSPEANFYDIVSVAEDYFLEHSDDSEGGAYANFKRWEWFWSTRVQDYEGNHGSFIPAYNALLEQFAEPVCTTNINNTTWNLLGPNENLPSNSSWPNIGRIVAVTIHPTDHSIMYVASSTSGVGDTKPGSNAGVSGSG